MCGLSIADACILSTCRQTRQCERRPTLYPLNVTPHNQTYRISSHTGLSQNDAQTRSVWRPTFASGRIVSDMWTDFIFLYRWSLIAELWDTDPHALITSHGYHVAGAILQWMSFVDMGDLSIAAAAAYVISIYRRNQHRTKKQILPSNTQMLKLGPTKAGHSTEQVTPDMLPGTIFWSNA